MRNIHRSLPSPIAPGYVVLKAVEMERANGRQGDTVWSNLVSEAWRSRGRRWLGVRVGGAALNPYRKKKKETYHFTFASGGFRGRLRGQVPRSGE